MAWSTELQKGIFVSCYWGRDQGRNRGAGRPVQAMAPQHKDKKIKVKNKSHFLAQTKHIELDYYFVRKRVFAKQLDVRFLSSKDQMADVLTKPFVSHRFQKNKIQMLH
jgi:hypothetical protein